MWYNRISECLLKECYNSDLTCPCVLMKKSKSNFTIIVVYVIALPFISGWKGCALIKKHLINSPSLVAFSTIFFWEHDQVTSCIMLIEYILEASLAFLMELTLIFGCKGLLTRVFENIWVFSLILGRKIMSFHRKIFKEIKLDRILNNISDSTLQRVKLTG